MRMSIGKDEAIRLYESKWWESCTPHQIVEKQLFTDELCCPFNVFHEAMEIVLDRPVWTHEFGLDYDGLVEEFLGKRKQPTMQEIVDLIPEEKRVLVVL